MISVAKSKLVRQRNNAASRALMAAAIEIESEVHISGGPYSENFSDSYRRGHDDALAAASSWLVEKARKIRRKK